MSRRALFLAVFAAAGMLTLTACTSSDQEIAQSMRNDSAGSAGTGGSGAENGMASQPADGAGENSGASGQDADVSAQEGDASGQGSGGENAPGVSGQEGGLGQTEKTTEAGTESQTDEFQTESASEADAVEDIWSGTYASDQETVTIALIDAKSFSFSFANSGIASTAEIDGTQAIYRGDDHHVVVFVMNEGVLEVGVSSEEDYDASDSPLNGMYVRQTVE